VDGAEHISPDSELGHLVYEAFMPHSVEGRLQIKQDRTGVFLSLKSVCYSLGQSHRVVCGSMSFPETGLPLGELALVL
jgi:hypothetical protein